MGYWNDVKDVVLKGVDLAFQNIKDGTDTAIDKVVDTSKDSVHYVNLKKDIFLKHRKLHEVLADLGDATHDLYKEKKDIYNDKKIQGLMKMVIEFENECKKNETEMKTLFHENNVKKEEKKHT